MKQKTSKWTLSFFTESKKSTNEKDHRSSEFLKECQQSLDMMSDFLSSTGTETINNSDPTTCAHKGNLEEGPPRTLPNGMARRRPSLGIHRIQASPQLKSFNNNQASQPNDDTFTVLPEPLLIDPHRRVQESRMPQKKGDKTYCHQDGSSHKL